MVDAEPQPVVPDTGRPVLAYESPLDRLAERPPLRGRWLAVVAALLFVTSFFLPAIMLPNWNGEVGWRGWMMSIDAGLPGWWVAQISAVIAFMILLDPSWDASVYLAGTTANIVFVVGLILFCRAATRRGRVLHRSIRPAFWFALWGFCSSGAVLASVVLTAHEDGIPMGLTVLGIGAYLWAAAPGVLAVASALSMRQTSMV